MRLKDVMTHEVEVVSPEATLEEAAQKMKRLNVGSVPVWGDQQLVGILTDRDITVRASAEGRDPTKTHVREVMTPDAVSCFEHQQVEEAARLMQEKQIRRLPILSRERGLVGIVSLGDLAVRTGDEKLPGQVLKQVSEPSEPER